MHAKPLSIEGAWVFTPRQFTDPRGVFLETYKAEVFEQTVGHPLRVAQSNCSVSAAGVIRGIHFSDFPGSQAKYVTCARGAIFDVVVDIRAGSPTFGKWEGVLLDDVDRRALYVSEGLGHSFIALEDGATVNYMCSTPYNPTGEHGVHPFCKTIGIEWPRTGRSGAPLDHLLSDKDAAAPGLLKALDAGLLPTLDQARAKSR